MTRPLAAIVLAAGLGKRTKLARPKVMLPLCGRSLLATVLDTVTGLGPERIVVVVHHGREEVERSVQGRPSLTCVDQGEPKGTGHAALAAMPALEGFDGDVLVAYGDMPLVRQESLAALRAARGDAAAAIVTAYPDDPTGLGRILRDDAGELTGIREERDCSEAEAMIDEINTGLYCYDAAALRRALEHLRDDNAQGEYYLTDTIGWLIEAREGVDSVVVTDPEEALGANSLAQLAQVRAVMQERILLEHLENGVLIEDPATTYIDHGVQIGRNTRILPCTVIRSGVVVGEDCEVGPFAHLRVGAALEDGAEIGNFVEVKQSRVGRRTKAKHLTYIGDTVIGAGANIGAGTITANYDGEHKHQTTIGDGAFIGSGTVLVAPVRVGNAARTGAGAIVTRNHDVQDGETVVGVPARPLQTRQTRQTRGQDES